MLGFGIRVVLWFLAFFGVWAGTSGLAYFLGTSLGVWEYLDFSVVIGAGFFISLFAAVFWLAPKFGLVRSPRGVLFFYAETGTEGGYWAFQDKRFISPKGEWSYKGLHILKDGDYLRIFSPDDPKKIVWEGEIKLREYPLFTEDARGFWIHADQAGVERETWAGWFFGNYLAELVSA